MDIIIRERNDIVIIDMVGDFLRSTSNISNLNECVKKRIKEGKRNFLFNLERVDDIDTSGIAEMLTCYILVFNAGGQSKYIPIKFFKENNLKIGCGIHVYKDEEEAIKSFSE